MAKLKGNSRLVLFKEVPILLISVMIIIAGLLSIIGYSTFGNDFVNNLLSEVVGLICGIIVTVLIVDRYLKQVENRRWKRVKEITHLSLGSKLKMIFAEALYAIETEYGG